MLYILSETSFFVLEAVQYFTSHGIHTYRLGSLLEFFFGGYLRFCSFCTVRKFLVSYFDGGFLCNCQGVSVPNFSVVGLGVYLVVRGASLGNFTFVCYIFLSHGLRIGAVL